MVTVLRQLVKNIRSLKLMIFLKNQDLSIFLKQFTLQIDLKKFLLLRKTKKAAPWTYVIYKLIGEETIGTFYEKGLQKGNQK